MKNRRVIDISKKSSKTSKAKKTEMSRKAERAELFNQVKKLENVIRELDAEIETGLVKAYERKSMTEEQKEKLKQKYSHLVTFIEKKKKIENELFPEKNY